MKLWQYALIVFLGGCSYGILSTFVKTAYSVGFTSAEVIGAQFLFGVVFNWFLVLFVKKKRKINNVPILKLILAGIPFGLAGMLYYQSLQTLNASFAIILLFQFVWIGTIFEWLFHKKKPTTGKLISIVVLLIGSLLAANVLSQQKVSLSWIGITWGLLAAISFALFIFLSSSIGKNTPPILKSSLLSSGGFIVVLFISPPTFIFNVDVLTRLLPYGLVLGIFGVVLPPLLFSIGLPHLGAGLGTIMTASELPMAVVMSSVFLSEKVTWMQWLGVIIILVGIGSSNIKLKNNNKVDSTKINIQNEST
ncbi:DMT family transporter [Paenibacillus sp. NPDC056933]|uniref:EamA family transporter n=1 Tax=Paenibacillus sp. NPDC056933 TaxID=3345968 RepID=UPI00362E3140